MRYYKIIKDKEFIGPVSSDNFIKYQPALQCFLRSDELAGEYVDFNCLLYRDTWMRPITQQRNFIQASIIAISEEEYNVYIEAMKNNEVIEEETEEEEPTPVTPPPVNPYEETSLKYIQDSKITEMSYSCRKTIENGFDMEIRGETYHFSLTTQDQLNLMNLNLMAQTEELIPYHADGEECTFYTADEINQIIAAATNFKNYQTAYYNSLKAYINALDTIEAVHEITYGTPIPDEYKSDVLKILE